MSIPLYPGAVYVLIYIYDNRVVVLGYSKDYSYFHIDSGQGRDWIKHAAPTKTSGQGVSPKTNGQGVSPNTSGPGVSPKTSGQGVSPKLVAKMWAPKLVARIWAPKLVAKLWAQN